MQGGRLDVEAAPGPTKTLVGVPVQTIPGAGPAGAAGGSCSARRGGPGPGGSGPGVEGGPLAWVPDAGWLLEEVKVERNQDQNQLVVTRSTCTWLKRLDRTGMCWARMWMCLCILPCWQVRHARAMSATSEEAHFHTNLERMSRLEARVPGWAMPWIVSNTCCLKVAGTTGLKTPVLMSPRRGWPSTCCVLKCRLDSARKAATSGHTRWAAARRW